MNTQLTALIQYALDYALQQPAQQDYFVALSDVEFFRQKPSSPIPPQVGTVERKALPLKADIQKVEFGKAGALNLTSSSEEATPVNRQAQCSFPSKPQMELQRKNEPIKMEPPKLKKAEVPAIKVTEEIRSILKKIAPTLPVLEHPPSDQRAQHLASGWKEWMPETDIVILLLDTHAAMMDLTKNLARAIQQEWGGVKIVNATRLEQEKRWDLFFSKNSLRLILVSPGLERYPALLKYYTAIPAQQTALLHQVPCMLLQDALTYQNAPEQKIILWKQLRRLLKK